MAVVWPSKNNFANGDVLTAANMNNIADTLNVFNPTSATNGQIWTANGSGSGSYQTPSADAWTSLASGNLTTAAVNLTGISQSYKNLHLYLVGASGNLNGSPYIQINNQSGTIYFATMTGTNTTGGVQYTRTQTSTGFPFLSFQNMDAATTANFFYIQFLNYTSTTSDRVFPFWTRHNATGATPTGPTVAFGAIGVNGYMNAINEININSGSTWDAGTYVLFGEK